MFAGKELSAEEQQRELQALSMACMTCIKSCNNNNNKKNGFPIYQVEKTHRMS